ncbi:MULTISPECIES: LacI family DNA-binding transcriptional regulator [Glutamicibacter]|uniref:Substrate-binding domain-containing protein n=1 Tax=Glutamicibacter halophytocola TaxID=1933880 RepID=A0AA95BQ89_9MICC|nr:MULTISPECIES: substrate-binding domain-containing protein [Glutamicibacter]MBF6673172.1 substrate-binding domain-containing protein [Glutamicibacter sp. FBE19]UUX58990.1 substrate-binding domain-containing protein [Glutamicibacter halophytocola]
MDNVAARTSPGPRFALAVQMKNGPHDPDPFFEELLLGLEQALDQHDASVLLRRFGSAAEELAAYRDWASSGMLNAVIIADIAENDERVLRCRELGLPVVVLGGPHIEGVSLVEVDNSGAMLMAVEHLAGLGHQRLGRVSGPAQLHHTQARTRAFGEALARFGIAGTSLEGSYSPGSGAQRIRELLGADPRPSAIIFDDTLMAVGGLAAARELGLRIPQDLSILAWDDSPDARLAEPPISVVSLDVFELGQRLAQVLLRTHAGDLQTVVHVPTARIVVRGSTAAPPAKA